MRSRAGVLVLVVGSGLVIAAAALGSPAGTAFTYQGQLDKNSQPANTSCNFQFSLWDALAAGNQVATMPAVNGIQVADGLFTTTLDFGAGAFTGQARWLQIAVQCTGDGAFTPLSPRQPLTPAPYAVFALGGNTGLSLPYAQGVSSPTVNVFDITNTATTGSGDGISGKTMSNGTDAFGVVGEGLATSGNSGGVLGRAVVGPTGTGVVGQGSANGAYFESSAANSNNGYAGVVASAAHTDGVRGIGGPLNAGVRGDGSFVGVWGVGGSHGLYGNGGTTGNGVWGDCTTPDAGAIVGKNYATVNARGVYGEALGTGGIGTWGVGARFGLFGQGSNTGNGVWGDCATPDAGAIVGKNYASVNPRGVYGEALGTGGVGVWGNGGAIGGYFQAPAGQLAIKAEGRVQVKSLEILGGADLAESFDVADEAVEPGTVVVIDAAHPGKLTASVEPNDSRVVGVISGAGGIQAGMSLRQGGAPADGQHQVALTGRVFVKCDASFGAIEPGTLLTTSPTPGHAMAVTDREAAGGAILGKAMTGLREGKGLVLVFVSLQ